MAEILIGTSGYYYPDWKGVFYPETLRKDEYLGFYSERFPLCELNYSYYRMPERSQILNFVTQTPETFRFSVKAFQSLTHGRGRGWQQDAETFFHSLAPMNEKGRLASVLIQFPFSFHHNRTNRLYLSELTEILSGLPLCIEFRNSEWMLEKVYHDFSARNICFVQTDLPLLDKLPLPTSVTTSDIGYIRFHGRNAENWWGGDSTSRYDYLYNDHELQSWICRIEEIASRVNRLLITFNNHHKGKAIQNAAEIFSLLAGKPQIANKGLQQIQISPLSLNTSQS